MCVLVWVYGVCIQHPVVDSLCLFLLHCLTDKGRLNFLVQRFLDAGPPM